MKKWKKHLKILSFYTYIPQLMIIMVPETWSKTNRIFCHFRLFFALLPPYNLENQNFEKLKKIPEDITILHMCTINENHIWFLRYGVWQTEFFLILDHFLPFYPLTTQKIKILKKWKNTWRYHHFTQVYHKWQSHDAWFLRYEAWQT